MTNKPELLAPAGQPDAGYAALHYGADAVYLGLNRFSARAEAVNFTPEELAAFAAYAHSLTPRRGVYLTLNTLVQEHEFADAAETLTVAVECGVDAVIVQDLGIARLVRERFPELHLHASTQMAIHNLAGAKAARQIGCSRVTLARELTLGEVRRIADESGLEVETFIHGTLCYSYSGLCLFSSLAAGRSGNRGRCVYSCREAGAALDGSSSPDGSTHPFSLKDMALGPRVLDLAEAGVASLKIEGRKKSPLYVAATVDYYRRILDGKLDAEDERQAADRLKTIFARPWTKLFIDNRRNPDVADTAIVGHRGAPAGRVEKFVRTPAGPGIAFTPSLPVERHDGLQIDLPGQARPFGFAVDNLYAAPERGAPRSVFAVQAGERAFVALPEDAPALSPGLPLYLSSSQAVKRAYPFSRSKGGEPGRAVLFDAEVFVRTGDGDVCSIEARVVADAPFSRGNADPLIASATLDAPRFPARDADGPRRAALAAFERTGGSRFRLRGFTFTAGDGAAFVKPGDWNRLRRETIDALEQAYQSRRREFVAHAAAVPDKPESAPPAAGPALWTLCVSAPGDLADFDAEALAAAEELVVVADPLRQDLDGELDALATRIDPGKIRLAVPLVLRPPAEEAMAAAAVRLAEKGWTRWLASNPGAMAILYSIMKTHAVDVAADWPLYVLNRNAGRALLETGCSCIAASPEDDAENLRELSGLFGNRMKIVVHGDLPLFTSAACAHLILGRCRSGTEGRDCPETGKNIRMNMEKNGQIEIIPSQCGSVVTAGRPFSLMDRLDEVKALGFNRLCVDWRWRPLAPAALAERWREFLAGRGVEGTAGNFHRGLL